MCFCKVAIKSKHITFNESSPVSLRVDAFYSTYKQPTTYKQELNLIKYVEYHCWVTNSILSSLILVMYFLQVVITVCFKQLYVALKTINIPTISSLDLDIKHVSRTLLVAASCKIKDSFMSIIYIHSINCHIQK